MSKVECEICGKLFSKYGIKNHISITHNGKKSPMSGKTAWNKGLSKETDERLEKSSNTLKRKYKSGELIPGGTGRIHSEETKKKISRSRIKYLKENPDQVPYILNHYSKGESYPEEYFRKILIKYGVEFKQEVRESLYSLDFVVGKIDLEIDGEQHYVDKRVVNSDIKRTEYLENLGYRTVRIRWSEYQKLCENERKLFIKNLIHNLTMLN